MLAVGGNEVIDGPRIGVSVSKELCPNWTGAIGSRWRNIDLEWALRMNMSKWRLMRRLEGSVHGESYET